MRKTQRQYTLRDIPVHVDRALRKRARESGKSFNRVAVDALAAGANEERVHDDLDFMIGTMSAGQAKALDREIARQRRVDSKLWR